MSTTSIPPTMLQSDSPVSESSANNFQEYFEFENHVISSLKQAEGYHDFLFTDVRNDWAEPLFDLLDEEIKSRKTLDTKANTLRIKVMPAWIHDCVQQWMNNQITDWILNGHFTAAERDLCNPLVGTTLRLPYGPYAGSRKEPDYFFQINGHRLPTVAVECGWSESETRLQNDKNLLLVGGQGSIRVVLIVKWRILPSGRVSGRITVFKLDRNGMPVMDQRQEIFPPPSTNQNSQRICLYRGDIFGPSLLAGRNAHEPLYLEIENLRVHATRSLHFMGLTPA